MTVWEMKQLLWKEVVVKVFDVLFVKCTMGNEWGGGFRRWFKMLLLRWRESKYSYLESRGKLRACSCSCRASLLLVRVIHSSTVCPFSRCFEGYIYAASLVLTLFFFNCIAHVMKSHIFLKTFFFIFPYNFFCEIPWTLWWRYVVRWKWVGADWWKKSIKDKKLSL